MMQPNPDPCVARYRDLKNLKLVGAELGIPWQTVYVRLRRAGEPVTGDKARYGSEKDRLAARGERWFKANIPGAIDQNALGHQAKVDFIINGHTVDVKVSRPRTSKRGISQWCWSVKKQEMVADFFVCLAVHQVGADLAMFGVLMIPGELARTYQTLRASSRDGDLLAGKWADYAIKSAAEMRAVFSEIKA